MIASDIMTRDVVSVGPDAPVADVVALMLNHRISAVPVVQNNVVIGILSEGDLLRRVEIGTEPKRSRWLEIFASSETVAADYVRSHGRKTSEVMTRDVITVASDTPIAEIARLLETKGIKRVPVTRDGALVGIVSRANLLQALSSKLAAAAPGAPTNDSQIREAVETEIRQQGLAPLVVQYNVIVEDGVVHLWGIKRHAIDYSAIVIAAENIAGVKTVVDHLRPLGAVLM